MSRGQFHRCSRIIFHKHATSRQHSHTRTCMYNILNCTRSGDGGGGLVGYDCGRGLNRDKRRLNVTILRDVT